MTPDVLRRTAEVIGLAADVFTIVASGLAIYVFVANRRKVRLAFEMLLSYSFQTSLAELKEKLERLNEYNANDPADQAEIRNILQEISGQLRGNKRLLHAAPDLATKVDTLARSRKLSEPAKRSLVSELREQLRHIQIIAADDSSVHTP